MLEGEWRVVWVNAAGEGLSAGGAADGSAGRRLGEVLPGVDVDVIERSLRRVLATGEPVFDLELTGRADGEPGGERAWSCLQFRIEGPDGEPAGVAHMMLEVTERIQNQRRLALADEASARIRTTLDLSHTAQELLDLAIPRLADAGAGDLLTTVIQRKHRLPQGV